MQTLRARRGGARGRALLLLPGPLLALAGVPFACGGDGGAGAAPDAGGGPDPEARRCIADHPPSEPFDVGVQSAAAPAPGSGAPAPEAPGLGSITAECRADGGSGCDGAFISGEAARCIAEGEGFEAGLEPWSIGLTYHHSYRRIVWHVQNLLADRGADGYSGESLTIDAVDGTIHGRTSWSAMP